MYVDRIAGDCWQEGADCWTGWEFSSLEVFISLYAGSAVGEHLSCVWGLNDIGGKMCNCCANSQGFNLTKQPSHLALKNTAKSSDPFQCTYTMAVIPLFFTGLFVTILRHLEPGGLWWSSCLLMHVGKFWRSAVIHHTTHFFLWIPSLQWLGLGDQAAPKIFEIHSLEPCELQHRSKGLVLLREDIVANLWGLACRVPLDHTQPSTMAFLGQMIVLATDKWRLFFWSRARPLLELLRTSMGLFPPTYRLLIILGTRPSCSLMANWGVAIFFITTVML